MRWGRVALLGVVWRGGAVRFWMLLVGTVVLLLLLSGPMLADPASPRKLLDTAVARTLGLMLGVFGAFAMESWRGAGCCWLGQG